MIENAEEDVYLCVYTIIKDGNGNEIVMHRSAKKIVGSHHNKHNRL